MRFHIIFLHKKIHSLNPSLNKVSSLPQGCRRKNPTRKAPQNPSQKGNPNMTSAISQYMNDTCGGPAAQSPLKLLPLSIVTATLASQLKILKWSHISYKHDPRSPYYSIFSKILFLITQVRSKLNPPVSKFAHH